VKLLKDFHMYVSGSIDSLGSKYLNHFSRQPIFMVWLTGSTAISHFFLMYKFHRTIQKVKLYRTPHWWKIQFNKRHLNGRLCLSLMFARVNYVTLRSPFPKGNPAGPQPFAVEWEQLRRDQQNKNHLSECSKMGALH
jgi:hypothetical protein